MPNNSTRARYNELKKKYLEAKYPVVRKGYFHLLINCAEELYNPSKGLFNKKSVRQMNRYGWMKKIIRKEFPKYQG